jgi:hypothetical protein
MTSRTLANLLKMCSIAKSHAHQSQDNTWIALLCWRCAKEGRSITWTAKTASKTSMFTHSFEPDSKSSFRQNLFGELILAPRTSVIIQMTRGTMGVESTSWDARFQLIQTRMLKKRSARGCTAAAKVLHVSLSDQLLGFSRRNISASWCGTRQTVLKHKLRRTSVSVSHKHHYGSYNPAFHPQTQGCGL